MVFFVHAVAWGRGQVQVRDLCTPVCDLSGSSCAQCSPRATF